MGSWGAEASRGEGQGHVPSGRSMDRTQAPGPPPAACGSPGDSDGYKQSTRVSRLSQRALGTAAPLNEISFFGPDN